jgi:hypothetical protein
VVEAVSVAVATGVLPAIVLPAADEMTHIRDTKLTTTAAIPTRRSIRRPIAPIPGVNMVVSEVLANVAIPPSESVRLSASPSDRGRPSSAW